MEKEQGKFGVKILKLYNEAAALKKEITLDIQGMLSYWEENKGEMQYKGKIQFSITERNTETKASSYAKAYVSKEDAKLLAFVLQNNMFAEMFPKGFIDHGGSNGQARIFSFFVYDKDPSRFVLRIEDGEGERTETGAWKMKKRVNQVSKMLSKADALKMALAVGSYIAAEEASAAVKGVPLFTLMPYQKRNAQVADTQAKEMYKEPSREPSRETSRETSREPKTDTKETFAQEKSHEPVYMVPLSDYTLRFGEMKGKKMKDLSDDQLRFILHRLPNQSEPQKELKHYALLETDLRNKNKRQAE